MVLIQDSEDEALSWICPVNYPFKMQLNEEVEASFSQDHWLENPFVQLRKSFMPVTLTAE